MLIDYNIDQTQTPEKIVQKGKLDRSCAYLSFFFFLVLSVKWLNPDSISSCSVSLQKKIMTVVLKLYNETTTKKKLNSKSKFVCRDKKKKKRKYTYQ